MCIPKLLRNWNSKDSLYLSLFYAKQHKGWKRIMMGIGKVPLYFGEYEWPE